MGSAEESAERLFHILTDALSAEASKRVAAEKKLRDAEEQQDFFASLAMILAAGDDHAPAQVRWLAAVVGKNAVNRSWRRRAKKNAVTEEERDYVRQTLLSCLGEPTSIIAPQISAWIARIARFDYPKTWPNLLTDLAAILTANNVEAPNTLLHALRTADEVFDMLASRRLLSDRKAMYAATPNAFSSIYLLFKSHLQRMLVQNAEGARSSFDIVCVAMSCMRSLILHGFQHIDGVNEVREFFADILRHPDLFLTGAKGGTEPQLQLSLLAAKTVSCAFERFPDEFHIYLPPFLDVYFATVTTYDVDTAADSICAEAAQFLRSVLECPGYNNSPFTLQQLAERNASESQDLHERGRFLMLSFFNEPRVDALIHAMLSKVFVLRPAEVSSWVDDPESFVREDDASDWGTFSLRAECESMFKTLLIRDKRRIAPLVISHAEGVPATEPLLRDAVYRAVGNAVRDLQGLFDFEAWFQVQLGPILQAPCGDAAVGNRIVQARAAWLVGQFVEQLSRDARLAVYALLVDLVARERGDRVVALTAVGALGMLAFDDGFDGRDFAPHLAPCVAACFRLLLDSDTLAMKREQLDLLVLLVKKSPRADVLRVVPVLAEGIPAVWHAHRQPHGRHESVVPAAAADEGAGDGGKGVANMVKTSVAVFLYELLKKIGHGVTLCAPLHHFVHEVVLFGTAVGGEGEFLVEEACDLWQILLACSAEYTEGLNAMFLRVPQILKDDAVRLKDISRVIESYVLLGRGKFLGVHGNTVKAILKEALTAERERGLRGRLAAAEIIDTMLQQFPAEGVGFVAPLLQELFIIVTTQPERAYSKVLTASYLALFARASLSNIDAVETFIFQGHIERVTQLFDKLAMLLDLVYRQNGKRAVVLALSGLSSRYIHEGAILQRVPLVLSAAVQVLAVEFASSADAQERGSRSAFQNAVERYGEAGKPADGLAGADLPELGRRNALRSVDAARSVQLGQAVVSLMGTVRSRDEVVYNELVGQVGPMQMGQLEKLVKIESVKYSSGA